VYYNNQLNFKSIKSARSSGIPEGWVLLAPPKLFRGWTIPAIHFHEAWESGISRNRDNWCRPWGVRVNES